MSDETKHSPGPWRWERYEQNDGIHQRLIDAQGDRVLWAYAATQYDGDIPCEASCSEANAALIARAPDLLAEVERLRGELAAERELVRQGNHAGNAWDERYRALESDLREAREALKRSNALLDEAEAIIHTAHRAAFKISTMYIRGETRPKSELDALLATFCPAFHLGRYEWGTREEQDADPGAWKRFRDARTALSQGEAGGGMVDDVCMYEYGAPDFSGPCGKPLPCKSHPWVKPPTSSGEEGSGG